jgi:hypothetical protein
MRTGLNDVIARLAADLPDLGEGPPHFTNVDPDMPEAVDYDGHHIGISFDADSEELLAFLANQFQDDVIDILGHTWPEVDGRPLFASATSGTASWTLNGAPFCPIGRLTEALAARAHPAA